MKNATITIAPDVAGVLERATIDGCQLHLREQLDRALYMRVAKVVEVLGGKWNRKAKAHVFDEDASEVVADALMSGTVVDLRKTYQEFPTPSSLADDLVEYATIESGDTVLEPSAGSGRIVEALRLAGADVVVCEIQERHHAALSKVARILGSDFLDVPVQHGLVRVVVGNPPFARSQDVLHVNRMVQWLRCDGGKLVSVMSPAWTFRTTTLHVQFRAWAKSAGAQWIELPDNTFAESGTNVRAGIFVAQIERAS